MGAISIQMIADTVRMVERTHKKQVNYGIAAGRELHTHSVYLFKNFYNTVYVSIPDKNFLSTYYMLDAEFRVLQSAIFFPSYSLDL